MFSPWCFRQINRIGERCFALGLLALFCVVPIRAAACPFCTAVSQTFSEEMDAMDVVAFARLIKQADLDDTDEMGELPPSQFEVVDIVKGDDWVEVGQTVEMHFFGSADKDQLILIMGSDPPQLMWGSPLPISDRGRDYLKALVNLPDGPERLEFFLDYLEDEDEVLTRDSYDEFAKQPYEAVVALKDKLDRQQNLGLDHRHRHSRQPSPIVPDNVGSLRHRSRRAIPDRADEIRQTGRQGRFERDDRLLLVVAKSSWLGRDRRPLPSQPGRGVRGYLRGHYGCAISRQRQRCHSEGTTTTWIACRAGS